MKNNQKANRSYRTASKTLSFMLAVVLIAGMLIPVGYADSTGTGEPVTLNSEDASAQVEEIPFELPLLPGDLSPEEAKTAELDMSTVPDVISAEDIISQKHVKRLYEQEPDDYTIMFQNRDLSKTTYIFSVPVKNSGTVDMSDISARKNESCINVSSSGTRSAVQVNNAALSARLGNPDIPGGLMSYNIGTCVIRSIGASDSLMSEGGSAASVDIVDEIRSIADARAANPEADVSSGFNLTVRDMPASLNSGSGITYIMMNTSDIAGDYAIRTKNSGLYYLKNVNNNVGIGTGSNSTPSARWLIAACGGNTFTIRSQSSQTMYMMERSSAPVLLYYEYSENHEWNITYETTVDGVEYWSIMTTSWRYLYQSNGSVGLVNADDSPDDSCLWGFMNKITCVDVSTISVDDHANVIVGDEIDIESLVTYYPSNATYKNITLTGVNSSMLDELETDTLFEVLAVGVNKVGVAYSYNDDISSAQSAIICSTGELDIRSSFTHMLRTKTDASKLLTLNVSQSNLSSTSLSLSAINETWNYITQAFTLTEAYCGAYKVTAALSTAQYEAPAYNGSGVMTGAYYLADENTKNNTLAMSGQNLCLTTYSASAASKHWYIVRNGDYYSFINAENTNYALSFSSTSVGVGSYSASSDSYKWQTTFLGMNVPLIKQSHNNYCGVASTLQILYALDSSQIDRTSDDLKDQMDALAPSIMDGDAGSRSKMVDVLGIEDGRYDAIWSNPGSLGVHMKNCLEQGRPGILHIIPSLFPRYIANGCAVGDGHYICIIGYDSESDYLVFSDCSCFTVNYGIYLVRPSNLGGIAALRGLVRVPITN